MTHAAYPIAKAHSLLDRVEADAEADELTMVRPCVETSVESGLFLIVVPKEEVASKRVPGRSSTFSGSRPTRMVRSAGSQWRMSARLPIACLDADPDLADEMIAKPPGSVFAGQFAPRGTIEREADAFRR
jgi:hypothetical protein